MVLIRNLNKFVL